MGPATEEIVPAEGADRERPIAYPSHRAARAQAERRRRFSPEALREARAVSVARVFRSLKTQIGVSPEVILGAPPSRLVAAIVCPLAKGCAFARKT
jgi:hypothetical protein